MTVNMVLGGGANPAGVQWTMTYPTAAVVYETAAVGASASSKSISCSGTGGSTTCIVFGFNTDTMPNGTVATIGFRIQGGTSATSANIAVSDTSASTAGGSGINASGSGGTITINQPTPVNQPPTATDASTTTNEDTAKAITLSGTDPNGDSLTFSIVSAPSKGSLSGTGANRTYTPNSNANGADSFVFQVNDGNGGTDNGTISITITPVNDPPTTSNQSVSTPQNTAKSITLTGSDVDGNTLTYSILSGVSHGSLSGSGTNRTYTPTNGYSGPDSFTFQVNDGNGGTANGTVSITVTATPNSPPTATDASTTTNEDTAKAITLSGTDPNGDTLTFSIVSNPSKGSLSGTGANRTYTPNANANGADSFVFQVNDGKGGTDNGSISITITPVNDPPTTSNQSVSTAQNTAKSITLTGSDVDGNTLSYSITSGVSHGSLSGSGANRTYTPTNGYSGPDSFTFQVNDGNGGTANGTVSITVTAAANQPPTATDASTTTNEDTAKAITLSGTDPNGDTLTFSIVSGPSKGSLSGTGANRTYTPSANANGGDSFVFQVNDGKGGTDNGTFSITITPVNDPPTTSNQSVSTSQNTAKSITLTGSDVDGNTLSYSISSGVSHGSLSGSGANRTYTPTNGYTGPDSFNFQVNDGNGGTANGTVNITVTAGANNPPTATNNSTTTNEDTPKAITLSGTDPNGDTLSFSIVSGPSKGSLSGSGANRTYTPNANANGADSFVFRVDDGRGGADDGTFSITITAVNDPPTTQNQSVSTAQNTPKAITLTGSDVDGNTLSYSIVSGVSHGSLSGSGANRTYTPTNGYSGSDSFTFQVDDGNGGTANGTVSITVANGGNNAPAAQSQQLTLQKNKSKGITLTANDPDGDTLTFTVVSGPAHGGLSGAPPNVTYNPANGYSGTDSFSFRVNDPNGGTSTGTISIALQNAKPTAQNLTVSTEQNTAKGITLAGSDADGDPLAYSIQTPPAHGSLSGGSGSGRTYTPANGYTGPDTFIYVVDDGDGGTATGVVSITVGEGNGQNTPPIATDALITTNEDTPKVITLAGTDSNSDPLTFSILNPPSKGTVSGSGASRTYTPTANANGSDSFTYQVSDGKGGADTAVITIEIVAVNDAPTAATQDVATQQGQPVAITLTGSDVDGDTLSFSVTGGPSHGTLGGSAPNLTYNPANGYQGSDSFGFQVSDGKGGSATGTVNITVSDAVSLGLSSLACNLPTLAGAGSVNCQVFINGPAPDRGFTVGLSGGGSQLVMPASVDIPATATSAPFAVSSPLIQTAETVELTATLLGVNVSTALNLVPLRPTGLSCLPVQIMAGETLTCEITLNSGSFSQAVSAAITSSSGEVQVPASVPLAPGQATASFQATSSESAGQQSVTIGASLLGAQVTSTISIVADGPVISVESQQIVSVGQGLTFTVVATDPGGLVVTQSATGLPTGAAFNRNSGVFRWTPVEDQIGTHEVTFRASNTANQVTEKIVTIEVVLGTLEITGVTNAASFSSDFSCSPGSLATLWGVGFTEGEGKAATTFPLPTMLGKTRVFVNNTPTRLLYVGPKQINLQCPALPPGTSLEVRVEREDIGKKSGTVTGPGLSMKEATPGMYTLDGSGKGQGLIVNAKTGKVAALPNPGFDGQSARSGDHLIIYANGLGAVDHAVGLGEPAGASPLSRVVGTVRAKIGGVYTPVTFAGLAPSLAGVYQVNIEVSPEVPSGANLPVVLELQLLNGTIVESNPVTIANQVGTALNQ